MYFLMVISLVVFSVSTLNMNLSDSCLAMMSMLSTMCLVVMPADMLELYLAFELTFLLLIPVLGSYSSAYSKVWAMMTVLMVIVMGSVLMSVYMANESELMMMYFCWTVRVSLMCMVATMAWLKVPAHPTWFWLPEAHVEATASGSILLAVLMLKYSLIILLMMLDGSMSALAWTLLGPASSLAVYMPVALVMSSVDLKSSAALFSMLHMNSMMLAGMTDIMAALPSDYLFSAHSMSATMMFFSMGAIYTASGSSDKRSKGQSMWSYTASVVMVMMLMDPPVSMSWVPELYVVLVMAGVLAMGMMMMGVLGMMVMAVMTMMADSMEDSSTSMTFSVSTNWAGHLSSLYMLSMTVCW